MDTRVLRFAVLLAAAGAAPLTGQVWTQLALPPEATYVRSIEVDPANPLLLHLGAAQPVYVSTSGFGGTFRSTDGGISWRTAIPRPSATIARDPSSLEVLYAATSSLFRSTDGGLFRSADRGMTWTAIVGLPSSCCTTVAVTPDGTVHAGERDTIWRSRDGGASWTPSDGLQGFGVLQIAINPQIPSVLYAGTSYLGPVVTGGYGGVFKSTDAGHTWLTSVNGFPFVAVAVDPHFSITVYASQGLLLKSTDAGTSWTPRSFGRPSSTAALLVDPERPFTVYAGTFDGVYRSTDGGDSWFPFGAGQGPHTVFALAMDRTDRRTLFAGGDEGLFRIDTAGVPETCTPAATVLCLHGGRFRVETAWQGPGGVPTTSQALPLVPNTGAFWFFSPDNLELVVKVLDGRSVNGKFWVFYGALSNVEYTITVTDTQTGAVKTYFNPQGQLASAADTSAF